MNAHPAVAESAALGSPAQEFGEEIAAFVRLTATCEPAALLAHARTLLPRPKWPRAVFVVDELPRNSGGKVLKCERSQRLKPPEL